MKNVTFNELVHGMVIYPKKDVNPPEQKYLNNYRIVDKIIRPGEDVKLFDGQPAMSFLEATDASLGICTMSGEWLLNEQWWVEDDQSVLDALRAETKKILNSHRDHMDECERLVDDNL